LPLRAVILIFPHVEFFGVCRLAGKRTNEKKGEGDPELKKNFPEPQKMNPELLSLSSRSG
jgi:hypothetical protein